MNIELVAFTFDFIGKIMVSFTAIMVHHRVWKEHKVDDVVFTEMHRERNIGLLGVAFMVVGYILHVVMLT